MLDLRSLELDRMRISVRREPVDDRPSRITESQQLRDFIERLSGSIVARASNVPVAPKIFPHLCQIEMGVAAGHHQGKHRKLKALLFLLPLLQQHGMDVSDRIRELQIFSRTSAR